MTLGIREYSAQHETLAFILTKQINLEELKKYDYQENNGVDESTCKAEIEPQM